MKKYFLIWMLFFILDSLFAQNLIYNSSFEHYSLCPNADGQINRISGWFQPNPQLSSTDFFHSCSSSWEWLIPKNALGFQTPKNGKSYIGLITFIDDYGAKNYREYAQTRLKKKLNKDTRYYAFMYVSLSEKSGGNTPTITSIQNMGLFVSKNQPNISFDYRVISALPQVESKNQFLSDRENWMKIEGYFIANGEEEYLTIGSFKNDEQTIREDIKSRFSYYYVDDVGLYDCDNLFEIKEKDTVYCSQTTKMLNVSTEYASYLWQDGSTDSVFTAKESGLYWVEVSLAEGCKSRDSVYVHFTNEAPPFEIGKDTLLCAGQTYTLRAAADSSVLWQDGSKSATYTVKQAGTYYAQAYKRGCLVSDTVHIRYDEAIIPQKLLNHSDTTLCSNETLTLSVNTQGSNVWYEWSNGQTSQNILVEETGTYRISVSTSSGCRYTEQISITFHDCIDFIPNVITPNDDGINETFEIQGIKADTWQLIIVNRWGKEVFKSDNYQNDWGKEAIEGVYYYHLSNLSIQKSWKGVISVLK